MSEVKKSFRCMFRKGWFIFPNLDSFAMQTYEFRFPPQLFGVECHPKERPGATLKFSGRFISSVDERDKVQKEI